MGSSPTPGTAREFSAKQDHASHDDPLPRHMDAFTSGIHPRILFLSGTHGDEYESGAVLSEYLQRTATVLPPFLFIQKVSPSAVAAGTRRNQFGNDINRQFVENTQDPEAIAVMRTLTSYAFVLAIDVHEDPDRAQSFYVYDSGSMTDIQRDSFEATVRKANARLYTGIDDVDDEYLRRQIDRGYLSFALQDATHDPGFSTFWMIRNGITQRGFTMEIPGKARRALKQSLIERVVPFLVHTFGV